MESSSPTELTDRKQPSEARSTLAKALAPEDIRPGDFVAVLHEVMEVLSLYWCRDSMLLPPDEIVRIPHIPAGNGMPLKVKSVCLPFVLTRLPNGDSRTLDVRQCQLAPRSLVRRRSVEGVQEEAAGRRDELPKVIRRAVWAAVPGIRSCVATIASTTR